MVTIIYHNYTIVVSKDTCTLKHKVKNKKGNYVDKTIGYPPSVQSAIERIAEHELNNISRTVQLKQYLKEYRDTVDRFWALIK